jgi:hypothetical protein
MKSFLKLLGLISIITVCTCACNKKCSCTTTGIPEYEGTIVYEQPNSKKACKVYQDNQNNILSPIGGQVTCVYE